MKKCHFKDWVVLTMTSKAVKEIVSSCVLRPENKFSNSNSSKEEFLWHHCRGGKLVHCVVLNLFRSAISVLILTAAD